MFRIIILFFIITSASAQENKSGKASYYNENFIGKKTSNGEKYNNNDFTAAHRSFPFNSLLLVTNKQNHKSVIVRVNDRGPFKRSRVIDLSQSAAKKIGMIPFGVVTVKITTLHYLDSHPLTDTLFKNGEVYDCYGNKKELSETSISIWKTDNIRHAIYMTSSISIEYQVDAMVKVSGSLEKRSYTILVSGINKKTDAERLLSVFKNDGFTKACFYK